MKKFLGAALMLGALLAGSAGAARQADSTPPNIVSVDSMAGAEFFLDGDSYVSVDVGEYTEDAESGVNDVIVTLASDRWADDVIHNYQDGSGGWAALMKPGRYAVEQAFVNDVAGNSRLYDTEAMRAEGFYSTFWVYRWSSAEGQAPVKLPKPDKGSLSGTPDDLASDDDSFVNVISKGRKPASDWTAVFSKVPQGVATLTVNWRGKADVVPCHGRLWIRNFDAKTWELLDERDFGPDEVGATLTPSDQWPSTYISGLDGPGQVWVRSTCEGQAPFVTSTDVLTLDWSA